MSEARRRSTHIGLIGWIACLGACAPARETREMKAGGMKWTESIKGEGLKNTFQVSPEVLRGGQPAKEGMKALEARGVRTVINLRSEASDSEAIQGTSLKVLDVPMKSWKADHGTIVDFLRAVRQATAEGKCFFH